MGGVALSTTDSNLDVNGGFASDYSYNDGGASTLSDTMNTVGSWGATIAALIMQPGQPIQSGPGRFAIGAPAVYSNQGSSPLILLAVAAVIIYLVVRK